MSETAHTPGPWVTEDADTFYGCAFVPVCTAGGTSIAEVCGDSADAGEVTERDHANARLIAAAPDLLAKVERAAKIFRGYAELHRAKKSDEADAKAVVNELLAEEMEEALAKAGATS